MTNDKLPLVVIHIEINESYMTVFIYKSKTTLIDVVNWCLKSLS